jgi:hypothetical protein
MLGIGSCSELRLDVIYDSLTAHCTTRRDACGQAPQARHSRPPRVNRRYWRTVREPSSSGHRATVALSRKEGCLANCGVDKSDGQPVRRFGSIRRYRMSPFLSTAAAPPHTSRTAARAEGWIKPNAGRYRDLTHEAAPAPLVRWRHHCPSTIRTLRRAGSALQALYPLPPTSLYLSTPLISSSWCVPHSLVATLY